MSDLIGAWYRGEDEPSSLDERVLRPLRNLLSSPGRIEVRRGPLWLCAHRDRLAEQDLRLYAYEGFLASGDAPLSDYLAARREPEGHYVAVRAEPSKRKLELIRSPSGGERLYFVQLGAWLYFACSLRPLLAHPELTRTLDPDVVRDTLLTGHPLRGDATPLTGIREVLPGHTARVGKELVQSWHCSEALHAPRGDRADLARRFREQLADGVARSIGKARPVAIALSGGIDSSAIAAALVEVVGADAVHAFSYEFDDPTHSVETEFARDVVRSLGIRRHQVFRLRFDEFVDSIPEHVWRSESAVHWPKAFLLPVARHLKSRGFDRYLTGFGIGSHMAYLAELAALLRWLPRPDLLLSYWRPARFEAWDFLGRLEQLHPALPPPHPRLYHLLLEILEARGMLENRRRFYPRQLHPLLREPRPHQASGTLAGEFQREAFSHLVSCIDITRSEKASREAGVLRISPAHFAGAIPYAYFPPLPAAPSYSAERRLRPGKLLLREAYRERLPDSVLYRKKSWSDAVVSPAWRKRGRVMMLRALPHHPGDLDRIAPGLAEAVQHWEPQSIQANCLAFRLWMKLFVEEPPRQRAPRWEDLSELDPHTARQSRSLRPQALTPFSLPGGPPPR